MHRHSFAALVAFAFASPIAAHAASLSPALSGLQFLVGTWGTGVGRVAETGGTSKGSSVVTVEAGGAVLLRRDHTALFDRAGKPEGAFDQIMMIYPEAGTLRAEYADGTHVIHYISADIDAGRSVLFTSAAAPGVPVFRLRYEVAAPGVLNVSFAMAPPGQTKYQPIATGSLHRIP